MAEDVADGVMEDEVGSAVHVGRRLIDEYQFFAAIIAD